MRLELTGKSFAGRPVLGPLHLTVERGQRMAVLGPSGIGKSTLLRILAGLDRDFGGRLESREKVAVVFQEPVLLPWQRAVANITLPTGCTEAEARRLMAEVGLAGQEDKFPRQLSLGQQRRLSLARAFAARPDILLMDEPFASLDRETAGRMMDLTARLLDRSGAGLVLITHDAAEASGLGAELFRLAGSPAALVRDERAG
ncbi:ABC transporter ATP-binding protein [Paracoccus fontiphilus]|uniref:ABC transporter ATP-binding protein n=1 Tax=Paracoccus fontiphilus TaxID=1815556 RepID=A0ABV7IFK0_9RHOB|nr:ATP-binding cassette domain-containing protein [Paracoccus fontiphilus]